MFRSVEGTFGGLGIMGLKLWQLLKIYLLKY